jgi:pseudouridine synthase
MSTSAKSKSSSKTTPKTRVRLQKVIAQAGIASRRSAEELIQAGRVTLNGETVLVLGTQMVPEVDVLEVDGERVRIAQARDQEVYALYKPKNCITSLHDPQGRTTIREFFPKTNRRLFPVGRLDYDAEGLILVTNDGELANQLMHPKFKVWKSYFVKVKGRVEDAQLAPIRRGITLEERRRQPAKVKVLHFINDKTWLEVSLREGTNQQIKKMLLRVGYPVLKIKRFRIGTLTLGEMNPGESRRLSQDERDALLTATS